MQKTITTQELYSKLSLCIGKEKPATRYMVAKVLSVSPTTANLWQKGVNVMDDANAEKVAELLGLSLDYVVLSLQTERANKSNLEKIAAIFERAALASQTRAASIFIGFLALSPLLTADYFNRVICILC